MYQHVRERKFYEDMYDRHTVEDARRGMVYYDKFYADFEAKLPKDDQLSRPGNALVLNLFYLQSVGDKLLYRYENREERISEWIERDEAKDEQIASARLSEEPVCRHCSKKGLRITDKSLMHRGEGSSLDEPEEVLFMLDCPHCGKTSAFWEDGTAWIPKPTLCPKCRAEMTHTTRKSKQALTFTYTCPNCRHSYKDRLELGKKPEKPDPEYESDRQHFCLEDKEFRERLFSMRRDLLAMAELGREWKEKEDNKHIYKAVEEMKKPKIAELVALLSPVIEKAGYIEFRLEQPKVNRTVTVEFSCLDNQAKRGDYDSRKQLQKLIRTTLEDTNWRLTGDGIGYRLGYLRGVLRAYEDEEDLKRLVMKSGKLKPKPATNKPKAKKNKWTLEGKDGRDIIL